MISTLVPTRGATVSFVITSLNGLFQLSRLLAGNFIISTLAPTRGATAKTDKKISVSAVLYNNFTNK